MCPKEGSVSHLGGLIVAGCFRRHGGSVDRQVCARRRWVVRPCGRVLIAFRIDHIFLCITSARDQIFVSDQRIKGFKGDGV
jgi:hypothetical protein